MEQPSNTAVVRAFLAAINDRDLDAVLSRADADIEVIGLRSEFEGPFSGHPGVARMVRDLWELAADYEIALEDVSDIEGRVLVLGRQRGRARESGMPLELDLAAVFELKSGHILAARVYPSREEAHQAAGLPAAG